MVVNLQLRSVPPSLPAVGEFDVALHIVMPSALGLVTYQTIPEGVATAVNVPPGTVQYVIIQPDQTPGSVQQYVVAHGGTLDIGTGSNGFSGAGNQPGMFSIPGLTSIKLTYAGPGLSAPFTFTWL